MFHYMYNCTRTTFGRVQRVDQPKLDYSWIVELVIIMKTVMFANTFIPTYYLVQHILGTILGFLTTVIL